MEPDSSGVEGRAAGRFEQSRRFFREVRNELERVTWPSKNEVYATTVVVVVLSLAMGLYLWGLDVLLDRLVLWILRQFATG